MPSLKNKVDFLNKANLNMKSVESLERSIFSIIHNRENKQYSSNNNENYYIKNQIVSNKIDSLTHIHENTILTPNIKTPTKFMFNIFQFKEASLIDLNEMIKNE